MVQALYKIAPLPYSMPISMRKSGFLPIFWLLFAINFCHMMVQNLLNTMPVYLATLNLSEGLIGFYQIIPSLILAIFIIWISYKPLANYKRYILRISFAITMLGMGLCCLFPNQLVVLFLGRLMMSFAWAAGYSLLFSMMYDHTPAEKRFQSAAVFGISGLLTNACGSLTAELVYKHLPSWAMFIPGLIMASIAFGLSCTIKAKHDSPAHVGGSLLVLLGQLIRVPLFKRYTILTLLFGSCFALFWNFVARISQVRLGEVNIIPFFVMFTVVAVLNRVLLSALIPHMAPRRIMLISFGIIAVALFGFLLFSAYWQLFVIGALYAVAHAILYPYFSAAFVNLPLGDKALLNNYFILLFIVGSTGGTQILALLAGFYGFDLIILLGIVLALLAISVSFSLPGKPKLSN